MAWFLLLGAIVSEVTGTMALRGSQGFTRLWPSVVVVVGYGAAFVLLAQVLKSIGVGPTYAIWSGLGTVGALAGGYLLFGERLPRMALVGAGLVIAGVVVMNAAGLGHG
jgi:small multidrug resistance pump